MNLKFLISWKFLLLLIGSFVFYLITGDGSEALILVILISYFQLSKKEK